jgi:hypothetical protein
VRTVIAAQPLQGYVSLGARGLNDIQKLAEIGRAGGHIPKHAQAPCQRTSPLQHPVAEILVASVLQQHPQYPPLYRDPAPYFKPFLVKNLLKGFEQFLAPDAEDAYLAESGK